MMSHAEVVQALAAVDPAHPALPAVAVAAVEGKLREHLERLGLGLPYHDDVTVAEVVNEITSYQGGFVAGGGTALDEALRPVVKVGLGQYH